MASTKRNCLFLLILSVFLATPSFAKKRTSVKKLNKKKAKTVPKIYSFNVSATVDTDTKRFGDQEKGYNSTFAFTTSLKLNYGINLWTSLVFDKQLSDYREDSWRDLAFGLSRGLGQWQDINFGLGLSSTIPFSERSREVTGLRTNLGISPSATYQNKDTLVIPFSISYRPSLKFYFHEYNTQTSGTSNIQRSASNRLIIGFQLSDSWSLSLDNSYIRGWTYDGNAKDSFSFDQSISYSIDKIWSVSAGHALGGSALHINGNESDVRLYDTDNSSFYIGLNFSY
jgi:hypothetical protein